jgi:hypothetical protein
MGLGHIGAGYVENIAAGLDFYKTSRKSRPDTGSNITTIELPYKMVITRFPAQNPIDHKSRQQVGLLVGARPSSRPPDDDL